MPQAYIIRRKRISYRRYIIRCEATDIIEKKHAEACVCAVGTSRCVASLHAPKVCFMCRKAHLVLKPAGCRIAVICGRCISAYVVVCGRCIVHRLCSTTCKLSCLATLCDRYQASLLEASKGRALNRSPQRAKSLRRNDLLKGQGNFSHEEKFPFNFMLKAIVSHQKCR